TRASTLGGQSLAPPPASAPGLVLAQRRLWPQSKGSAADPGAAGGWVGSGFRSCEKVHKVLWSGAIHCSPPSAISSLQSFQEVPMAGRNFIFVSWHTTVHDL